jgi:hypothetical protein
MSTSRQNRTGAGIIVWTRDVVNPSIKYVLVGKESRWLEDLNPAKSPSSHFDPATLAKIKEFQEYTVDDEYKNANMFFTAKAKELETILKRNPIMIQNAFKDNYMVRFDTPKKLSGKGYGVHYRFLPNGFKRGIVKGGTEPEDMNDRQNTILREFAEEVGIKLPKADLSFVMNVDDYDIFQDEISGDIVKIMNSRIQERTRDRKGEMYDLVFKSSVDILKTPMSSQRTGPYYSDYNKKSQVLMQFLSNPSSGGRKHTTGRRHTEGRKGRRHTTSRKHTGGRKHTRGRRHTTGRKGRKHTTGRKGRKHTRGRRHTRGIKSRSP